jgi:hypothetical protein
MPRRRGQAVGGRGQRLARRGARESGADKIRDRHDVGDAEPFEGGAKLRGFPIGGIGDHGLQREAGREHRPYVGDSEAPLLAKRQRTRYVRLRAMIVVHPHLREVQLHRRQPGHRAGNQRRRHGDLTIGNLAERAAVLPLHADRRGALLRQAGVVDRQDPGPDRNRFAEPSPERTHLPGRMRDEVLQALIRAGIAQPAMHRLHRFPAAVVQQPLQVPTGIGAVCSRLKQVVN